MRSRRKLGMSLIELMVALGILSIIATGMFQVFQEGLRLFRTNQAATDAQSAAIKTLAKMNTELINANPDLVEVYSAPSGVVFASPLIENGNAQFHPVTGAVYWQKYVCYFHVPDLSDPIKGKLYRSEAPISDEVGIEPGYSGNSSLSQVEAGMQDTNYFASATHLDRRLLGASVSGFTVKEFDGSIEDANGAREAVSLGGASLTRELSLDILLEAGDRNDRGPDGYFIRVDSRITPRG